MKLPYEILEQIAYKYSDRKEREVFVKSLGSEFEKYYYRWKHNRRLLPIWTKSFVPRKQLVSCEEYNEVDEDNGLLYLNVESSVRIPIDEDKEYLIHVHEVICVDDNADFPPETYFNLEKQDKGWVKWSYDGDNRKIIVYGELEY